jgi:hypothetical protein
MVGLNFLKNRRRSSKAGRPVYFDWQVMVLMSSVIFIGIVSFCYYVFEGISREEIFLSESKEKVIVGSISQDLLETVLSYYNSRATHFADTKGSLPSAIDPSVFGNVASDSGSLDSSLNRLFQSDKPAADAPTDSQPLQTPIL